MKRILIIGVILAVGVLLALFVEGKLLLNKFGPPVGTNIFRDNSTMNIPNELVYSFTYNNCLLQNRKWSKIGGVCVVEYKDGGKVCSVGKDCLSGKCLLGENDAIFRRWSEMVYKQRGIDPNKSVGPGDEIIPMQLPDNIKGVCSKTNLCDYGGSIIQTENGARHAEGSHCFEI